MENDNLKELVNIFFKWKKFMVIFILLAVLVSGFISFFVLPDVYKGSAILCPPLIGGTFLKGFSPYEVESLIKSPSFLLKLESKTGIDYNKLESGINISIPKRTSFIKIEFESVSKDDIITFFDKLIEILREDASSYEKNLSILKSEIDKYEKEINLLDDMQKRLLNEINKFKIENGGSEIVIIESIYNSSLSRKVSLEKQVKDLKIEIVNSNPFVYLATPTIQDKPVKPNKLFNILTTAFAALLFSILSVFLFEFWYKSKKEKNS